ncbi:MAG: NAD+ synthase [Nitrospinae bacterium]|nr:NAD+ synthase [Nitrospinota bacterium]
MIRIALAQVNPVMGDFAGNERLIAGQIAKAREAGAALVVFPELVVTGYPPEDLLYKRKFITQSWAVVDRLASATRGIAAIIGFPHEREGNLFNAAAVMTEGTIRHIEHKSELPNYGVFDEKRYFTPAKERSLVEIAGVKVAITICEDIWIPNGPAADLCAHPDARLIVNLSSSPYHIGKTELRRSIAGQWAKRFGHPLAYCNLVGGQDELVFDGGSFVCSAGGEITSSATEFGEDLLMADLPIGSGAVTGAPIAPRKTPSFQYPQNAYEALKLGVRDYVEKNRFKDVIVALSGGIDSALTAHIAVAALGAGRVRGVSMPSHFSSEGSVTDARELAANLDIRFDVLPIGGLMDAFGESLKETFAGTSPGIAEENIQARIRGLLVMAISNKFGNLVLTTGNKSEISVGYCTLYGDTAGGFAVIKDLPKTGVYDLCRWINAQPELPGIPEATIAKPPSAELRPNQKDSDSLPEYAELDPILKLYVEDEKSIEEITTLGYSVRQVRLVADLVSRSEYKRRQSAPGVRITPKAFGKDRRVPITNRFTDWGETDK